MSDEEWQDADGSEFVRMCEDETIDFSKYGICVDEVRKTEG